MQHISVGIFVHPREEAKIKIQVAERATHCNLLIFLVTRKYLLLLHHSCSYASPECYVHCVSIKVICVAWTHNRMCKWNPRKHLLLGTTDSEAVSKCTSSQVYLGTA